MTVTKKELNEMFDNLLHIGNKVTYWNPRMRNYIYASVNWIHVINLLKTKEKIEEVKKELTELSKEWKKILFVATKLQARDAFVKLAEDTWNYYVSEKWVPWLLTNFRTIKGRISTYLRLLKDSETWAFDVLTKKEKASRLLELEKLNKAFGWLRTMKKLPDIVFVVDGMYEDLAIKEANSLWIKVYSIFNTNWDDTIVDNMIPANTNSVKSLWYIAEQLSSVLSWIKPEIKSWTSWVVKKVVHKKTFTAKKTQDNKKVVSKIEEKKEEKDNVEKNDK